MATASAASEVVVVALLVESERITSSIVEMIRAGSVWERRSMGENDEAIA